MNKAYQEFLSVILLDQQLLDSAQDLSHSLCPDSIPDKI